MDLKRLFGKVGEKDEKFKEMEEQAHREKILTERQKSANERELEGFVEERRQERITNQLQKFRQEQRDRLFQSNILGGKNIFKGQDNILKGKSLFGVKTKMFGGGMFFK